MTSSGRAKAVTVKEKMGAGGRPEGVGSVTTLSGIIQEMATTYHGMKAGRIKLEKGSKLVWVLDRIRDAVASRSLEDLQEQLAAMSKRLERQHG